MTEQEIAQLESAARATLKETGTWFENRDQDQKTRLLAELALKAVEQINQQRQALAAVKRGVSEWAVDGCPFCDGYVGFDVDDPVLDERGVIGGHDDNCPWPLVKLALGENQVRKEGGL